MSIFQSDIDALFEYSDLCNDELGEACSALAMCADEAHAPFWSVAFQEALEAEVAAKLKTFREHSQIIVETSLLEQKLKRLEWN